VKINAPEPVYYMVFVESRALGTTFRELPYLGLRAAAPPAKQTP
jgi:hypothetical protein